MCVWRLSYDADSIFHGISTRVNGKEVKLTVPKGVDMTLPLDGSVIVVKRVTVSAIYAGGDGGDVLLINTARKRRRRRRQRFSREEGKTSIGIGY